MRRSVLLIVLCAVVVAGCGGLKKGGLTPVGDDEATKPPPQAQGDLTVNMVNISYRPKTISVRPGATVTWVNRDKIQHTVTVGDELYNDFNSGPIEPGKSYRRKLSKKRKIGYRCTIHPNMEGSIFVGEG